MKLIGCEIFNEVDNKHYAVYTEWFNSHFKIMLLETTMPPLSGEMSTKDIKYFCDELYKSYNEYLEETKKIFCGKDTNIKFFVNNKTLEWKNDLFLLGKIELHVVSDIQVVCNSFQELLKLYQNVQDRINVLEEENKNLTYINKELNSKIEEMIEIKTTMEQDLYRKFIIVLNSKKKKIRELMNVINNKQNIKESVFDVCTDESEESEKEDQTTEKNPTVSIKVTKRKSPDTTNLKNIQKTRKVEHIINDKIIHKPSTSKDCTSNITMKNINTHEDQSCRTEKRKSRSSLNFNEETSEEELFSQ